MKQSARLSRRPALWLAGTALALLAAVVAFDALRPPGETVSANAFLMGTVAEVQLAGTQEDAQAVFNALRTTENETLSRRRADSTVSSINEHTPTGIPAQLEGWLGKLQEVQHVSGGAFSILLGRLSDLWNFDSDPTLPAQSDLDEALASLAQGELTIEQGQATLSDGLLLDLGAAGKGIGCDIAKEILTGRGVSSGVVSVGGSLLLLGSRQRSIAIRDPFGEANDVFATLRLSDCFVSTSGNYEKYFDRDGVRYHHILNPATGYPADAGLCSVTVVCGEGVLSDALSTACFVLGIEKSRPLLERYGADAVFITSDGETVVTAGLADVFILSSDSNALSSLP